MPAAKPARKRKTPRPGAAEEAGPAHPNAEDPAGGAPAKGERGSGSGETSGPSKSGGILRNRKRRRGRGGGNIPEPSNPGPEPTLDPEELKTKAWKIYLAELSEEGVELFDDSSAGELARRAFRLAETFLRYEIHYFERKAGKRRADTGAEDGPGAKEATAARRDGRADAGCDDAGKKFGGPRERAGKNRDLEEARGSGDPDPGGPEDEAESSASEHAETLVGDTAGLPAGETGGDGPEPKA